MGGDVDGIQLVPRKQHERGFRTGKLREQFGMSIEVMPRRVHGRLVQRRCHDHGDLAGQRQFYRRFDVTIGRLAAGRADLAVANLVLVLGLHVGNRHFAAFRVQAIDKFESGA